MIMFEFKHPTPPNALERVQAIAPRLHPRVKSQDGQFCVYLRGKPSVKSMYRLKTRLETALGVSAARVGVRFTV